MYEPNHKSESHQTLAPKVPPAAPKVLLADTTRWAGTTRLALELSRVGIGVAAVCPDRHPLLKTREHFTTYPYSARHPEDSLVTAIAASQPNLILPCDERAAHHLRELHTWAKSRGRAHDDLAALIEKSLGNPDSHSIVGSRHGFLDIARQEGLLVPDTQPIESVDDLVKWEKHHPFPWVLKADGTWGGGGVKVVHTMKQAAKAYSTLRRMFNLRRVITKICVARDLFLLQPWRLRVRPAVTVQSYIDGSPANCGFVAWQGRVLACISVEAVNTMYDTGPASVVRVIESREMLRAAEKVASRLGLSGFAGLDFMIDKGGEPYLIEMNPRCTPLCHLRLGPGQDMIEALRAQLTMTAPRTVPAKTKRTMIAYFPQAWHGKSELHEGAFQDIPENEPELAKELLQPWPSRTGLSRLTNYLCQIKAQGKEGIPGVHRELPPQPTKGKRTSFPAEPTATTQTR